MLETEAAFNIPTASGGVAFFGTYMYGGVGDPSWNEIDQTFINGPYGLEFHGSLFISNPPYQSNAQEDKDVFDSTGTNCNSYMPAAGQPGNLKGKNTPYTCPLYSTTIGAAYHTYKLIWTPGWLAWTVDNVVYRNSTAAPWRPVTMRPLLRTNVGTAASVSALPDANVYGRRIRYTPLDAAGLTIKNALACTSMAACFGNLANNAAGMLQLSTPTMAAAGRRRLQQLGPLLDANGNQLPAPAGPAASTPYLTELATVSNATQYIVANVLPGILPSQVMVTITGHTISGVAYVSGMSYSAWTAGVQAAFVSGLAIDVIPTPDLVFVSNAADASVAANWASIVGPGTPMPANAAGVLVSYTVDGYTCDAVQTTAPCTDAGFSYAASDMNVLNNLGPSNAVTRGLQALLPGTIVITDVSPGSPSSPNYPVVAATVGVGINIFATVSNSSAPSPTDVLEAMFDSALNSGIISNALAAAGIGSASAPNNVQTARATRAADDASGCPILTAQSTDPYMVCPAALKQADTYKAVMIAFVVGFGVMIIGFFAGIAFMLARASAYNRKSSTRIPTLGDDGVKAELK